MRSFIRASMAASLVLLAGCDPSPQSAADQARQKNLEAQGDIISRATTSVPVPRVNNFLARENLAEYMRRMDDPAKTWYIYVLGDNGAQLGYYVASTYPQSVCTFMTPPEDIREMRVGGGSGPNPVAVVTSPALDGIYYKGGGCETVFFFDAESSAMVMLTGMNIWASDIPLDLDAPRISVAVERSPDAVIPTGQNDERKSGENDR